MVEVDGAALVLDGQDVLQAKAAAPVEVLAVCVLQTQGSQEGLACCVCGRTAGQARAQGGATRGRPARPLHARYPRLGPTRPPPSAGTSHACTACPCAAQRAPPPPSGSSGPRPVASRTAATMCHSLHHAPPSLLPSKSLTPNASPSHPAQDQTHLERHDLLHHAVPPARVPKQRKDLVLALFVQRELGAARAAHVERVARNGHLGHPAGGDLGHQVLRGGRGQACTLV